MQHKAKALGLSLAAVFVAGCASSDNRTSPRQKPAWKPVGRASADRAVDAPPPNILPETHFAAAQFLEQQGQNERAIVQYRKAVALNHNYAEAYHRLGVLLSVTGEHDEATHALRRAVTLRPDNGVYRNDLGFELMFQEMWTDAEGEFRKAIECSPALARAHINLGLALGRLGQFDEALEAFRSVLPGPDAYYNLGLILRAQGQHQRAEAAFEKSLSMNPNFAAAETQLQQLVQRRATQATAAPEPEPIVASIEPVAESLADDVPSGEMFPPEGPQATPVAEGSEAAAEPCLPPSAVETPIDEDVASLGASPALSAPVAGAEPATFDAFDESRREVVLEADFTPYDLSVFAISEGDTFSLADVLPPLGDDDPCEPPLPHDVLVQDDRDAEPIPATSVPGITAAMHDPADSAVAERVIDGIPLGTTLLELDHIGNHQDLESSPRPTAGHATTFDTWREVYEMVQAERLVRRGDRALDVTVPPVGRVTITREIAAEADGEEQAAVGLRFEDWQAVLAMMRNGGNTLEDGFAETPYEKQVVFTGAAVATPAADVEIEEPAATPTWRPAGTDIAEDDASVGFDPCAVPATRETLAGGIEFEPATPDDVAAAWNEPGTLDWPDWELRVGQWAAAVDMAAGDEELEPTPSARGDGWTASSRAMRDLRTERTPAGQGQGYVASASDGPFSWIEGISEAHDALSIARNEMACWDATMREPNEDEAEASAFLAASPSDADSAADRELTSSAERIPAGDLPERRPR
ncbi:MAG: tetratricopeptide repeat protein [Planctomycetes bacterium]|nr:tetratricopeptide repeat protein [Planctomycetota bacterium]